MQNLAYISSQMLKSTGLAHRIHEAIIIFHSSVLHAVSFSNLEVL